MNNSFQLRRNGELDAWSAAIPTSVTRGALLTQGSDARGAPLIQMREREAKVGHVFSAFSWWNGAHFVR